MQVKHSGSFIYLSAKIKKKRKLFKNMTQSAKLVMTVTNTTRT